MVDVQVCDLVDEELLDVGHSLAGRSREVAGDEIAKIPVSHQEPDPEIVRSAVVSPAREMHVHGVAVSILGVDGDGLDLDPVVQVQHFPRADFATPPAGFGSHEILDDLAGRPATSRARRHRCRPPRNESLDLIRVQLACPLDIVPVQRRKEGVPPVEHGRGGIPAAIKDVVHAADVVVMGRDSEI
jgi:hypothetical protein